jgi:hypothetical protein
MGVLVVTWQLGHAAFVDWLTIALGLASAVMLIRWRVNSACAIGFAIKTDHRISWAISFYGPVLEATPAAKKDGE